MQRVTIWVIVARVAQIAMGFGAMGLAIAYPYYSYGYDYDPYSNNNIYLQTAAGFCSGGLGLLGIFGLFGITKRPDELRAADVFLLIFFIDCWAVATSVAAGTLFCLLGSSVGYYNESAVIGSIVLAFLPLFAIIPLMIRTIRLWRVRVVWRSPEEGKVHHVYHHTTSPPPPQELQTQYVQPPPPPPPQFTSRSYQPEEVKGDFTPTIRSPVDRMSSFRTQTTGLVPHSPSSFGSDLSKP